jgi:hypothetical protein
MPTLPPWMPSERVIAAMLVMLLVLTSVVFGGGGAPKTTALVAVPTSVTQPAIGGGDSAQVVPLPPTMTPTPDPTQVPAQPVSTVTTDQAAVTTPAETTPVVDPNNPQGILPSYRVVSYYGHPHSKDMGILGEYDEQGLLAQLRDEAAAYEAADPSRPVMPAFELITSVAQNWPADDNTYLLHTDAETIQNYVDFTRDNGIILILDLQIGHSTVKAEVDKVSQWLKEPHVHLALDPEFAMADGQIPGDAIGSLDASDVAVAQQELANIVAANNLPPKMLIVHRFTENMITNADQITPVDGVQTVIDFDGFGDPGNKTAGYDLFINQAHVEHAGIKLFYQQDDPLMTPDDVVALDPSPDVVVYQ